MPKYWNSGSLDCNLHAVAAAPVCYTCALTRHKHNTNDRSATIWTRILVIVIRMISREDVPCPEQINEMIIFIHYVKFPLSSAGLTIKQTQLFF